jgi:parallel beta-helix repeat protein
MVVVFFAPILCGAGSVWSQAETLQPGSGGSVYQFPENTGGSDITGELQAVIDKIQSGVLLIRPGSYEVSDIVRINGKSDLTISFEPGAHILTRKHGYGIFEITDSSHITISGGQLEGAGHFLPKNYGKQAGGGEKQATIGTWGVRRNGDENSHGRYNGGYIGNAGIAILIRYGCTDITVENMEISNFNYSGVQTGFLGDKDSLQSRYSHNITVRNCYLHDNYGCGISIHAAENVLIENNVIEKMGNPEATSDDYEINPGYGITIRKVKNGGFHGKRVNIINNLIRHIARKGIDAHSGEDLVIKQNHVEDALVVGISLGGNSGFGGKALVEENTVIDCGTANGARVDAKIGILTGFPDTQILRNNIINSGKGYSMYCAADGCRLIGNQVLNSKFISARPLFARGYGNAIIQGVDISNNVFRGKFKSPLLLRNITNSKFDSNTLAYDNKSLKLFELDNCNLKVRNNTNVEQ